MEATDGVENAELCAAYSRRKHLSMRVEREDVICELSYERRDVSLNLEKLKNAINANPDAVSEKHKELWKKQAAAMEEYKRILGERIKNLIGE